MRIISNLKFVIKKIRYIATRTPAAGLDVLEEMVKRMQVRLNVPGDPIDYPVNWDSLKQKKAFFATNGFDGGIPYTRRNGQKFTVTRSFDNQVDLFGAHPAGAVFGMPTLNWWQSRIHRGRWIELRKVFTEEMASLPAKLLAKIRVVFNEAG